MAPSPTTRASLLLRLRDSQDHEAWVDFVSLYEPVAYRLLRRHGLQDADARGGCLLERLARWSCCWPASWSC
jgi:hypothetical protein